MELPIFQIDAFTSRVFCGNPAAVVPLTEWLPDAVMQAIAMENNLSDTAFFVPRDEGYDLRWFTPRAEIDLCGHATLATAHLLFSRYELSAERVRFSTKSGWLEVSREEGNGRLCLDFPARPPAQCAIPAGLHAALGSVEAPAEVLAARDYMVVLSSEKAVRALAPDMAGLAALDRFAVIVTGPGEDCDFVSRFFAPATGIPEDPVTGSAHCTLIPYWSNRLGKTQLLARQVSARGGELFCEARQDRVRIAGHAALYMQGTIYV